MNLWLDLVDGLQLAILLLSICAQLFDMSNSNVTPRCHSKMSEKRWTRTRTRGPNYYMPRQGLFDRDHLLDDLDDLDSEDQDHNDQDQDHNEITMRHQNLHGSVQKRWKCSHFMVDFMVVVISQGDLTHNLLHQLLRLIFKAHVPLTRYR